MHQNAAELLPLPLPLCRPVPLCRQLPLPLPLPRFHRPWSAAVPPLPGSLVLVLMSGHSNSLAETQRMMQEQ